MRFGIFNMQSQKCHIEVQIFEVVASISNVLAYQGRYWYLLELFYPSPDPAWQETINNQQGKSLPTLINFFFFKEKKHYFYIWDFTRPGKRCSTTDF